jgi:hypothetical protein
LIYALCFISPVNKPSDNNYEEITMRLVFTKALIICLTSSLLAQLTACGTILHPERKGQKDGQIDPAIAVFDAIGLLFFLIPGVIAFAVDFSNGTIYLPGGRHSSLSDEELKRVAPEGKLDQAALVEILRAKGLADEQTQAQHLQIHQLDSLGEVYARLAIHDSTYTQAAR